ncbi:MAG: dipeptidase [Bacteroidales bacterium]|jgi:acetylornithine deacetylase/succinyl-diaminopimelate desuccinylase-like protein|nr:dipeptidase [Bacteroidales bacterium]HOW21042.1 dipeptidase [Tenuifilaceae bacterium]HOY72317.1 dipeptidase [Tenuifilaceae bacterium]HPG99653.1 dipeptidase [Tenuifilaceae bacterium]HPM90512.1 dipeptidase [Tenuifilaceae bacterium]
MDTIKSYVEANKNRFLEELFELLRIPSISTLPEHKVDMLKAAEYWKKTLIEAGSDRAVVMPTAGNPVVYAEKIINPALPTVLVYAHYDVMPVDPLEQWISDPFEPQIRDGKIWARGANDDKGQSFIHAKAFELMVKTNSLPCNVKFMIEGEEEVGSVSLGKWCADNKELLKSDIILISDTSMMGPDTPSITVGLRGLAYVEVEVAGPSNDLHSGLFGGAVANPAIILAKMIASLHDENNRITIPGFYDDVLEVSAEERAAMARAPFNLQGYKNSLDIDDVHGEVGFSTIERTGIRPSLDVNGMWSGYTGNGAKTVLPSKAFAKISMRLVPNQDYNKVALLFKDYFESLAPKSVKVKVNIHHGGQAYMAPITTPAYLAASLAIEDVYGKKPIPFRSGGSIPIVSTFEQILGVKSLLIGFGLESDAIHSPNENFSLHQFFNGIDTIARFYGYFGGHNV